MFNLNKSIQIVIQNFLGLSYLELHLGDFKY
jgi:hypothetical protein